MDFTVLRWTSKQHVAGHGHFSGGSNSCVELNGVAAAAAAEPVARLTSFAPYVIAHISLSLSSTTHTLTHMFTHLTPRTNNTRLSTYIVVYCRSLYTSPSYWKWSITEIYRTGLLCHPPSRGPGSLVVRASDLWSRDCEFDSRPLHCLVA